MKTVTLHKVSGILSCLLLPLFILCSCTDEPNDILPKEEAYQLVDFSFQVPISVTPPTKALAPTDENNVQSLEVLLFDTNGNYAYQPIYIDANGITTLTGSNGSRKQFTVRIPQGIYSSITVLANSRQSVQAALPNIAVGQAKASVMSQMVLSNSTGWNRTPGSAGYIPIPMWGEMTNFTVGPTTPVSNALTLTRMLARIDVNVSPAAQANFSLTSVYLYNYNNQGLIAPLAGNWSGTQATGPSIPSTAQKPATPVNSPIIYSGADITTTGISSQAAIYTFETAAGSAAGLASNTCIVVGGRYTGDTADTYYRLDFYNGSSYLSLLRNYQYIVNITAVGGSGYLTPNEAFNADPLNMGAITLTGLDNALVMDVVYDDQYVLAANHSTTSLPSSGVTTTPYANSAVVYTDYPGGWTVTGITDVNGAAITWLTLPYSTGAAGSYWRLYISSAAVNGTGAPRTGYIHFRAGRLTYTVSVTQPTHSGWAGSNIYWNGSNMTFDDVGVQTNHNYLGLFFTWGSLYGVSPVGSWDGTQMLYTPSGTSGTATSLGFTTWASWSQITSIPVASDPTRAYLYEITGGSNAALGDICKHISDMGWEPGGKKWRMPTSAEFDVAADYTNSGTSAAVTPVSQAGLDRISFGTTKTNGIGTPFLPGSGCREPSTGVLYTVGSGLNYWTSAPYTGSAGYAFSAAAAAYPNSAWNTGYGFSVRCVAE
jgi:hypothetical protein